MEPHGLLATSYRSGLVTVASVRTKASYHPSVDAGRQEIDTLAGQQVRAIGW